MKEQTLSCLALSLVPGLGIVRLHHLLKRWGAPGEILRLPSAELKACRLSSEIRKSNVGGGALRSAERVIRETRERGISLLSLYDPGYPQRLKEIYQPPLILYGQGQIQFVGRDSIAIVGSRSTRRGFRPGRCDTSGCWHQGWNGFLRTLPPVR